MSGQIPRPFRSIALVAALLISGVGVAVPSATARADDCLTAPNSAAPQGSHWYYRLDRATQRQCWYTRAPGQPAQQVAAPATTGPAAASHSTPTPSVAPSRPVSTALSPKVKTAASRSLPPSVAGQPQNRPAKRAGKRKYCVNSGNACPTIRHIVVGRDQLPDRCTARRDIAGSVDGGCSGQGAGTYLPGRCTACRDIAGSVDGGCAGQGAGTYCSPDQCSREPNVRRLQRGLTGVLTRPIAPGCR